MDVEIRKLPATRVAYMRHTGAYGGSGIARLWQRFATWCDSNGFTSPRRPMYGLSLDDPSRTPPEKCRYDACVPVDAAFKGEGDVGIETIPAGAFACTPFNGTADGIVKAWMAFHGWAQTNRYHYDARPPMEIYGADYKIDAKTGVFTCLLCIPIKIN